MKFDLTTVSVWLAAFAPMGVLILAMVILLFMIMLAMWRKTVEETEIRTSAIQRVQRQQTALFEMADACTQQNEFSPALIKEFVRRAGAVLRADLAVGLRHLHSARHLPGCRG